MQINTQQIRRHLESFNFKDLLIQELGWDHCKMMLKVRVDDVEFSLDAVAEKRGMVVFVLQPGPDGSMPQRHVRKKIENQVAKSVFEHIIVFTNADKSLQVWQWVKREPGKPTACRENHFHPGQTGEALIQKLQGIAFDLPEEESLDIVTVAQRTKKAFDVEKVTKKFYDRFRIEHKTFLEFIKGIEAQTHREWYASLMLNRMMFVYFIQKKGFLDSDPGYLKNRLRMMQERAVNGRFHEFYRLFLLRLFHEGLGQPEAERKPELAELLGKVPYLDGGLFDVHELEREYPDINIPDEAFDKIFNFFDAYTWHLDERPLRHDNEINPDVLGYIFEKYINQKQMGAYYTKEDITGYITRNTIIPFLFNAAEKECKIAFEPKGSVWGLLMEDPDRYIYKAVSWGVDLELPANIAKGLDDVSQRSDWNKPADPDYALPTETWREHAARRKRCLELREKLKAGEIHNINDLITYNLDICQFAQDVIENCEGPELLRAFWVAIAGRIPGKSNETFKQGITVLDPTCGSGAFLFAALNILEPLYEACLEQMRGFMADLEPDSKKLRDFRNILAQIRIHPNERYFVLKSIIINNLYGVDIMAEAVEICKLRLFLKLVAQVDDADQVEPLPDIDFNIRTGNTLVGFATHEEARKAIKSKLDFDNTLVRIEENAKLADRAFQRFREMQTKDGMDAKELSKAKAELRNLLDELHSVLDRYLAGQYGVDAQNSKKFFAWCEAHQPFHWFVEFYGIIHSGGFGVIIGNPPYIEYRNIKNDYSIRGYKTEECGNIYCNMMERSFDILNSKGTLGMIVPLSVSCTDRMKELRQVLENQNRPLWYSHFSGDANPSKLFDGVKLRLDIVLTGQTSTFEIFSTFYLKWFAEEREYLFPNITYIDVSSQIRHLGLIPKTGDIVLAKILRKVLLKSALSNQLRNHGSTIYVHRVMTMYVKCFNFIPYFWNEQDGEKKSEDYKPYIFDENIASAVLSFINSSIFFIYFISYGDCFHCGKKFISTFPAGIDRLSPETSQKLSKIGNELMADLKKNAIRKKALSKKTGNFKYDEFWPSHSKHIIDKIDKVIAEHYGFTEEELDFIINYDIKYRMGKDLNDVEDSN